MGPSRRDIIILYQQQEIHRLERNLEKLAAGETDLDLNVAAGNEASAAYRETFLKANQSIEKIAKQIGGLEKDTESLSSNIREGNLEFRIDTSVYSGRYAKMGGDINAAVEAVADPFAGAGHILELMAVNDYTVSMDNRYKGAFASFATALNTVQERMAAVINIITEVSDGNLHQIERVRQIGRRSANDNLVPSILRMMEAVQSIVDSTERFSKAASEGNLGARENPDVFAGEYGNIIRGLNKTMDAMSTPIKEVIDVMSQMCQGNLKYKMKGVYLGEFGELESSVNTLVETLNHVIAEIGSTLSEISHGNLNLQTVREFKGDFNLISESMNTIIASLNETFREINTAAEQVSAGAGQISESSQILSRGSEEQASSVEEVTASITEMSAQVKQTAANAVQADKLSQTAKDDAVKGNQQMKEMVQAMHDINEASNNISKIIKVIDDIAFQTNILALNAAVEAARAGQYGKGFAVVAEEVKNLAQQSAGAAKETTTMIEGSIEKVAAGTKIANSTEVALNEIVDSITKTAELVGQIASASNEQALAISQVNQAVEQVSQVIQTNSATAEESASASEELSGQADMLKQTVNKVKLREIMETHFASLDSLSPDLIRAIQEMIDKKARLPENKGRDAGPEKKVRMPTGKPMISLDDGEFGKY